MGQGMAKKGFLCGIGGAKELRTMVKCDPITATRGDATTNATALFDDVHADIWGAGCKSPGDGETTQSRTYYNKSHINLLHYSSEQHTMLVQVYTCFLQTRESQYCNLKGYSILD